MTKLSAGDQVTGVVSYLFALGQHVWVRIILAQVTG